MRRYFSLAVGLVVAVALAAPAAADHDRIQFIGEVTFPTGYTLDGVEVGGLSGITWDAAGGVYYAISDDRSQIAPAALLHVDHRRVRRFARRW